MSSSDLATGRAEALNKTITEIMKFLKDSGNRPGGPRARLRPFLRFGRAVVQARRPPRPYSELPAVQGDRQAFKKASLRNRARILPGPESANQHHFENKAQES